MNFGCFWGIWGNILGKTQNDGFAQNSLFARVSSYFPTERISPKKPKRKYHHVPGHWRLFSKGQSPVFSPLRSACPSCHGGFLQNIPKIQYLRGLRIVRRTKKDPVSIDTRSFFLWAGAKHYCPLENKRQCPGTGHLSCCGNFSAACAAANRAMGTRNGEQDT